MKKISFLFFCAVVIFLPFAALLGNILEFKTSLTSSQVFWITHWYEIFLPLVFVFSLFSIIKTRKVFNLVLLSAVLLVAYSISIIIFSLDKGRSIEGFRFAILPVVFFVIASLLDFSKEEKRKIIKLYLTVAFVVALWAIIERFLPFKYWNNLGLIDPVTIFGWGWHGAGGFIQSASFLGGPNQLASYLLPAVFLTIYRIQMTDNSKATHKTAYCLLSVVFFLAIMFTQSRSAIVGLAIGFLIYIYLINKNTIIKYSFSGLFLALVIALLFLYQTNTNFRIIVSHGEQTGHQTALVETASELKNRATFNPSELFFGSGLGTAGPLAIKYNTGIISESWYLQLFLEIGLLGLALWLWFVVSLLKTLFEEKKKDLFLGLLSVSVAAIFLHTWADNPAVAYSLFILLGITIGEK